MGAVLHPSAGEGRPDDLKVLLEDYERNLILAALVTAHGSQRRAAALLGVRPTTLNEKMKRLGLRDRPGWTAPGQASPAGTGEPDTAEEFRWRGPMTKGTILEVRGLRSSVRAEPAAGRQAEVVAIKRGTAAGRSRVEIKVTEHAGGVTVCALSPTALGSDRGAATPGDVPIDFLVSIPEGVRFVARTLKGNMEVKGAGAGLELQTYSGSLRLSAEPGAESLCDAGDGPAA